MVFQNFIYVDLCQCNGVGLIQWIGVVVGNQGKSVNGIGNGDIDDDDGDYQFYQCCIVFGGWCLFW